MKKSWLIVIWLICAIACVDGGDDGKNDGGDNGGSGPTPTGNQPPTAFAGDDRTVALDSLVTLDGSQCSDADNDPLTFNWQMVERPEGSNASLSAETTANPQFTADAAGQYIVNMDVSDGTATSSDSVIITATVAQPTDDCDQVVPGENEADDFVCAHNAVRDDAQPVPNPPLPHMSWDPALEQIARDWAENCTWEHNEHRSKNYPGYVGENLYVTTWDNSTPETAVQSWADEAQFYNYADNTCQPGEVCGHYTQIVWRDSVKIGCARVLCPTVAGLGWNNANLYVCNYAPGGNSGDGKPY